MSRPPDVGLSLAEARRIGLAAQGFGEHRPPGRVDRRHLRRAFDRMGVVQIDSVNVVARSQELTLFARLGPHPRTLIPAATSAGELFEYWAHEASHLPSADHPLFRWAMESPRRWGKARRFVTERSDFIDEIHAAVRDRGPVVASQLSERTTTAGSWWDYDDAKIALEVLFDRGCLSAVRRPHDFARVYDLTERVLPAEILDLPTVPEHDAKKHLLVRAARHHGVGTAADLSDYHRLTHVGRLLDELVDEGRLVSVDVEGWSRPAYMHPDAAVPDRIEARALLSPFDPVIWHRGRVERLFGFEYRIEIYTPRPKRRYGYYVLPFLLGDELVARVDLKSDRRSRRLLVQAAWSEPGVPETDVAAELRDELMSMAAWLELDDGVALAGAGDLTPALRRAGVPIATPG